MSSEAGRSFGSNKIDALLGRQRVGRRNLKVGGQAEGDEMEGTATLRDAEAELRPRHRDELGLAELRGVCDAIMVRDADEIIPVLLVPTDVLVGRACPVGFGGMRMEIALEPLARS